MGKVLSLDLRKRLVAAVITGGLSCNQAAKQFGVAVSTAIGWVRRQRETGSVAPGKIGGHRPKAISGEHRVWVLERIKRDFTLRGLVAEFAERGLKVDYRSVWEFIHAEKLSFKKKRGGWRTRSSRRRSHGQSRQPQRQNRASAHPFCRRQALLPAQILARPEPHRAGLRQAQTLPAKTCRPNGRNCLPRHRRSSPALQARRMRKLLGKLRIWSNLTSSRFRRRFCLYRLRLHRYQGSQRGGRLQADDHQFVRRRHCLFESL